MTDGPTSGASDDRAWSARPISALAVRSVLLLAPIVGSFLAARIAGPGVWHPEGRLGAALFLAQVAVIG